MGSIFMAKRKYSNYEKIAILQLYHEGNHSLKREIL